MSEHQGDVLRAIAELRLELVTKLTDQAMAFRDRLDDIERRTSLELRENVIKIWERIERLQHQIFEAKSDGAHSEKREIAKRATDYRAVAVLAVGALVNVALLVFQYVFHIK